MAHLTCLIQFIWSVSSSSSWASVLIHLRRPVHQFVLSFSLSWTSHSVHLEHLLQFTLSVSFSSSWAAVPVHLECLIQFILGISRSRISTSFCSSSFILSIAPLSFLFIHLPPTLLTVIILVHLHPCLLIWLHFCSFCSSLLSTVHDQDINYIFWPSFTMRFSCLSIILIFILSGSSIFN